MGSVICHFCHCSSSIQAEIVNGVPSFSHSPIRIMSTTKISPRPMLTDFDWKLKMILESNKLSSINMGIIELEIALETEIIKMELNEPELKKLMDSIKEMLNILSITV